MADIGQVLAGRYRVIRQIGAGGMAAVYRAGDLRLPGRVVAIKEMSLALLPPEERPAAQAQFLREAQFLARLHHPGLTTVTDFFDENDRSYLVMDFIEGQTLAEYLAQSGRVPPPQVISWARQLGDVLTYLHNLQPPIVFRDLKPSNVIVSPDNRLHLIDFGIARPFQAGKMRDTQYLGTPGYAAPEQYGTMQTDPRTDVYSLGVVVHQMLTGFDPTQAAFNLPPPTSLVPGLDPAWDAVIAKATAVQPQDRFLSAAEFCNNLPDPLDLANKPTVAMAIPTPAPRPAPSPVVSPPAQPPARPAPSPPAAAAVATPKKRSRLAVPALVALVLVVLGALAALFLAGSASGFEPLARLLGRANRTPAARASPSPTGRGPNLLRPGPTVTIPGCPAITVDGQAGDWSTIPGFAVDKPIIAGNWTGPADLAAQGHLCWSAQTLDMLVQITDDSHVQPNTGRAISNGDDIEIQFDADLAGDFTVPQLNGDDYQLGFSAGGDVDHPRAETYRWYPAAVEGWLRNGSIAVTPAGQGYILEAAVPWQNLDAQPAAGKAYGFCLNVHDVDTSKEKKDSYFSNCPARTLQNPTTWGNLILQ